MNTIELTHFITAWRGYILGKRFQWYPHQRVAGFRSGWSVAAPACQLYQFKRVAALLGSLFVGGANLWLYGSTRLHIRSRPLRESDYQDRPREFRWGRAWSLWWSGQLSNSVYIRWRRTRLDRLQARLGKPYPYRRVHRRRRRRQRLTRRWARLRREGRLPRGCYRRLVPYTFVLRQWWRRRVVRKGWLTPSIEPTPLYRRRWGGSPVVGPHGLTSEWLRYLSARVLKNHRRRRRWVPTKGVYRWGSSSFEWVRPNLELRAPARRYRRRTHRVTRWVARFQGSPGFFPGVVGTTATGTPPILMKEAHAVGLPTVLWATGVAPELTPWMVSWPSTRLDGLWRWLTLVWGWSRGAAFVLGVANRLSVGDAPQE